MKMNALIYCIVGLILVLPTEAQLQSQGKPLENLLDAIFGSPAVLPSTDESNNPCSEGECVLYYLCANESIITNGIGLISFRIGDDKTNTCPGPYERCCTLRSDLPTTTPKQTLPIRRANSSRQSCGFRNLDGVGFRILGEADNRAQFGRHIQPNMCVYKHATFDQVAFDFQCTGSLIHPSVVLTAAHCIATKRPKDLKIRAGDWDIHSTDEILPYQERQVAEILVHPEYNSGTSFNNIALVFLDTPVDLADNINTICLPAQNANFDGSRCIASGWGKNQFGKTGMTSEIMKHVELPMVAHDQCQELLRQTRLGIRFQLDKSFVCAGGELGRDTCEGDGGSPLVCPIADTSNQYEQTGIVAWGIGCGDRTPGVYANVAFFRDWIDEHVLLRRYDLSYY